MKKKNVFKAPLEAYTRKIIEDKLSFLKYNLDEMDSNCNIYRERAKTEYQDGILNGKNPDFIVYKTGTDIPLAIIEAKRLGVDLDDAINQAITLYAKPLNVPVVFVFNGFSFYACSLDRKPLKIDKIEISDFVDEKTLIDLIENNFEIETVPVGFSLEKDELLSIFKKANNLLRKAGLRDGYERFSVFSDLLFLKLKNDFSDYGTVAKSNVNIDKTCNWEKLMSKTPKRMGEKFTMENSEVKSYLEDSIKPKLREKYGDVFENSLNINDETILIDLLELIDDIDFKNLDTDIKGDAFEFFLRNVTNGNKDLGEYYTPRHIVKMIVNFLNPKVGDKIYDSCCGTGGFLLECFKYLLKNSNISDSKIKKTIREETIYGRELTSTARISKMNMILFGDGHSNIVQMDSLSKPVLEEYDIAISNIPYSQNNIEYGNLYPFPSDKGDSVFVQHLWQSVKKGGRLAVVLPDPFLYDDGDVKQCREWILNNAAEVVVISLPRGVFNPYTPTKTSVLIARKRTSEEERKNQHFGKAYFYVIRNDGFELGAKRRPLKGVSDCNKFLMDYNKNPELRSVKSPNSIEVTFEKIKNNQYNLFPFEYMEHLPEDEKETSLVDIGKYICEKNRKFDYSSFEDKEDECVILSVTKNGIYINETCTVEELNEKSQKYKKVFKGDLVYNPHRVNIGSIGVVPELHANMYVPQIYPVFSIKHDCDISPYFFLNLLKKKKYQVIINDYCLGGARANLKIEWLSKIKFTEPTDEQKKKFDNQSKKLDIAYKTYIDLLSEISQF